MLIETIGYIISGFFVGFIVGLTGVGGGSLMTPILILGFSVSPIVAVGTDLLFAALTKSNGIFIYHAKKNIDWKVVKLLAIGSIPMTCLCVLILKYFNSLEIDLTHIINKTLSVSLILTSLAILLKDYSHSIMWLAAPQDLCQKFRKPLTIFAGMLLGMLVTFSSVGAGALGAGILFFLYPRMPTVSIIGTDLAHAVPITAIAGIGHAYLGTVNYILLGSLLIGSIPGIYLGGSVSHMLPERIIRPILASILMIIGVRLAI